MMTRIGKYPMGSVTRYSVVCEGFDKDQGLIVVPVIFTSSRELAHDLAKKLNGQLLEGIYDTTRVMEFYVEEEQISLSTEVDEEMLREFLSPNWGDIQMWKHPPKSEKDLSFPDPTIELMRYIYEKEVPNESNASEHSDSDGDSNPSI